MFGRRPHRDLPSSEAETPPDGPRSGRITALTAQKRDADRMNVSLDGEFAFGLHADLVLEHGLHIGMEVNEEFTSALLSRDTVRKATAAALQFLSFRSRSEGEIATRLQQRGFPQDAIDATLTKLRDWHYVDDADFANRWVEQRQQHRPRSARLLAQELRTKGVEADTADQAIAEAGIDEVGDARELARKQRAKLAGLDPETQARRITGFLARRGYGYEVIRRALEIDEDESLS